MLKKILKITGISLLVILLLLIAAPFLFKGKIIRMIKDVTNENLIAKVDFDESISLSLIKNFPDFTIGIKDLSVIGINTFEGDTLFYVQNFQATVDIKTVIGGDKINLKSLILDKPVINLLVNKEGAANWDIAIADTTEVEEIEEESKFAMEIKSFEINDAHIYYEDKEMDFTLFLNGFNHKLSGDFSLSEFLLKTKSEIQQLTMTYEGVPFLNKVHTTILADLNMDMDKFRFGFAENKITLNELELSLDGWMQMNDNDMDFDLKFGAAKNDFKHFISLIPALYSKDFASLKTSGKLGFDGYFKGKMTDDLMPGYGVNLTIDNGYFKYPDLPAAVEKVQVKLLVENKTGLDPDFVMDLSKLSLEMDKNPFDLKLLMKNMANPYIDGAMKGNIDLGGISRLVPLDDMEISGLLNADMDFKGTISKMESGSFEDIDAQGNLAITNLIYKDTDFPEGVNLDKFSLNFTPRFVTMSDCKGRIGASDFDANGQLSNFFAYAMSDGILKGNLNFKSNHFNANQFMTSDASTAETVAEDTSTLGSIEIPQNIDFNLKALVSHLKYDNMDITNLKGDLTVREGKIFFKNTGMELIGGTMLMDGVFDGVNPKMPFADINFKMQNFDIPKAFVYFDLFKQYAPFAEKMTGLFALDMEMESNMDEEMNMIFSTLTGSGTLRLTNATLSNAKIMNMLADELKLEKFRKLEMKDQRLNFRIDKGQFLIDSFVLPLWENTRMKLAGSSTVDQGLNYVGFISMPRKDMGVGNTAFEKLLGEAKKKGLNLEASEMVNVALSITGDFMKPIIKLDLRETASGLGKSLADQAKDQVKQKITEKVDDVKKDVKEKVDDAKEEARRKAQEEADRIMATAQAQSDRINNEAKTQADRVRKEGKDAAQKIRDEADKQAKELIANASNPAQKFAAERGAEKIRKEADEKATALENEANRRAATIENEAKKRTDTIMQEAQKKADDTMNKV